MSAIQTPAERGQAAMRRTIRPERHLVARQATITPPLGMQRRTCQRDGCKHTFTPKRSLQRYCSQACVRLVLRLTAQAHNRQLAEEREAKRRALREEARRQGKSYRDALELKLEKYWRKVEDPDYYAGLRYAVGSCLRGENPVRASGITLGRRDELGYYGGDRGRGR
jgi:hypothetical protein